jgi:hypothetical protein
MLRCVTADTDCIGVVVEPTLNFFPERPSCFQREMRRSGPAVHRALRLARLMPESTYDVIQLIGTSTNHGKRPPLTRSNKLPNLSAMFASRKSSNSICNWTRDERWKPIARRSSFVQIRRLLNSNSERVDRANACSALAPCWPVSRGNLPTTSQQLDTLQREAIMLSCVCALHRSAPLPAKALLSGVLGRLRGIEMASCDPPSRATPIRGIRRCADHSYGVSRSSEI